MDGHRELSPIKKSANCSICLASGVFVSLLDDFRVRIFRRWETCWSYLDNLLNKYPLQAGLASSHHEADNLQRIVGYTLGDDREHLSSCFSHGAALASS
jgi:hypothetical protein